MILCYVLIFSLLNCVFLRKFHAKIKKIRESSRKTLAETVPADTERKQLLLCALIKRYHTKKIRSEQNKR